MLRRVSRVVSLLLAGALFVAGCADESPAKPKASEVTGTITVFAASSLTDAFTRIGKDFETRHPGTKVVLNFAASSALAQQIAEGAPADLFASADPEHIADLPYHAFAAAALTVIAKPDSAVRRIEDLPNADVVSLCAVEAPCGKYAAETLRKAKVVIAESHVTRGPNAAATLGAVVNGDAEAGIVYVPDARRAGKQVRVIAIPRHQNTNAFYAIAPVPQSKNAATGLAFIASVRSDSGQRVLQHFGFLRGA